MKNKTFGQKSNVSKKIKQNGQKSKPWSKSEIMVKHLHFGPKLI